MRYLVLIIIVLLTFSACIKIGSDCRYPVPGEYEFQLTATLTPAKDTFRVGDTIIIESTFDNQVFERKTQVEFTLDDFLFFPLTAVAKLDTTPVYVSAIEFFDYFVCDSCEYSLRSFSTGLKTLEGQYHYDGLNYYLRFGLIPQKPGVYLLNQGSSLYPLGSEQDFPGKCGGESDAYLLMNGGGDNHLDFLEEAKGTEFYTLIMDKLQQRYYDGGGYCFYVTE